MFSFGFPPFWCFSWSYLNSSLGTVGLRLMWPGRASLEGPVAYTPLKPIQGLPHPLSTPWMLTSESAAFLI